MNSTLKFVSDMFVKIIKLYVMALTFLKGIVIFGSATITAQWAIMPKTWQKSNKSL